MREPEPLDLRKNHELQDHASFTRKVKSDQAFFWITPK